MTVTPSGVNSDDDEVNATSVIDQTDDDLFLSGLPMSVKQEMVNEDSVNHFSDGGVHFPGQEMVNGDSINYISDGGVDLPIFMTGVVDAKKNVAVLDTVNAVLQAGNDKTVNILLRGKLAEMMVRIGPVLYLEYVTFSATGVPMLYVRLSKAL